jgi:hypothetical protein
MNGFEAIIKPLQLFILYKICTTPSALDQPEAKALPTSRTAQTQNKLT